MYLCSEIFAKVSEPAFEHDKYVLALGLNDLDDRVALKLDILDLSLVQLLKSQNVFGIVLNIFQRCHRFIFRRKSKIFTL